MGHLVTVQNLHTALGLPLNLDREDYPWGSDFYPVRVHARAPVAAVAGHLRLRGEPPGLEWPRGGRDPRARGRRRRPPVNRVGVLYEHDLGDPRRPRAHPRHRVRRRDRAAPGVLGRVGPRLSRRRARRIEQRAGRPGAGPADPRGLLARHRAGGAGRDQRAGRIPDPGRRAIPPMRARTRTSIRFITIFRAMRALDPPTRGVSWPIASPLLANPTPGDDHRSAARDWAHLVQPPLPDAAREPRARVRARRTGRHGRARGAHQPHVRGDVQPARDRGDARRPALGRSPRDGAPGRRSRCRTRSRCRAASTTAGCCTATCRRPRQPAARAAGSVARYLVALAESDRLALAQVERMLGAVPA